MRKKWTISRERFCEVILHYDNNVPWNDLAATLRGGPKLDLKAQDRMVYIIQSEALKTWLLKPKNAALLIRGMSEDFGGGSISPISFFAAYFIQSIQDAQERSRLIGLFWFAEQHENTRTDANANVHGVVRSLIGQLLHAYGKFGLYFIKQRHARSILEDHDLETLCDIFDNLLLQLPRKKVTVCVIDWLACLEFDERSNVEYLVKRLLSIVRHPHENGSLFRLLLTHTGGAFRTAEIFEQKGSVMDVPQGGSGNRMGFSQLVWQDKVDGKFEDMASRSRK